jgi:hypothetical protein
MPMRKSETSGGFTARRGAKSCYPGKGIVAGQGRAMMFILLWLTEARRYLFPVIVW